MFLGYCELISTIVAFTQDCFIHHLTKGSTEGRCSEKVKVKLGGNPERYSMEMNDGMLVMCYGEKEVRAWDLVHEENVTISLETNKGFQQAETVNVVTVNGKRGRAKTGNWKERWSNE